MSATMLPAQWRWGCRTYARPHVSLPPVVGASQPHAAARGPALGAFRSLWHLAANSVPPASTAARAAAQHVDATDQSSIDVEGKVVDERIPVTVITGFLGSGKTTLLNNILTKDHGRRLAVIENEFGEIDIDSELVSVREDLTPGDEQIMMLNNGCLCCTVRDDLIQLLGKLYERRDKFDRVVIETTGLANPAPIIQTFFLDPTVAERMKLDGVVTLVDAKHVERRLDEDKAGGLVNEAVEQIAYADRIVLNKTDLVTPADLDRLESRLRSINSMAAVRRAQRAEVPLDYVLGVGGFDLQRVEEEIMGGRAAAAEADGRAHEHGHEHECAPGCSHASHAHGAESSEGTTHTHDHDHDHEDSHSHDQAHHHHHHGHDHKHDDAVTSVSISLDGDLDLDKVNYWLGGLIEVRSEDLYRMKGVLAIDGFDARFVFQGVHMLFEGMPDREWREGEKRTSRMVFIGKDLDAAVIKEGFEQCLVRRAAP